MQLIPMPMDNSKQRYIQQMDAAERSLPSQSPNSY